MGKLSKKNGYMCRNKWTPEVHFSPETDNIVNQLLLLLFSYWVLANSFVTPWTVAYQVPLSMGFCRQERQEYWSGLPFPSSEIFLTQGSNLCLANSLPLSHQRGPKSTILQLKKKNYEEKKASSKTEPWVFLKFRDNEDKKEQPEK